MKQTLKLTDEKQAPERVRSNDLLGCTVDVIIQATLTFALLHHIQLNFSCSAKQPNAGGEPPRRTETSIQALRMTCKLTRGRLQPLVRRGHHLHPSSCAPSKTTRRTLLSSFVFVRLDAPNAANQPPRTQPRYGQVTDGTQADSRSAALACSAARHQAATTRISLQP